MSYSLRRILSVGSALWASLTIVLGQTGGVAPTELRLKSGGRVWVYVPPTNSAIAKLPCVIVPPAGSRLIDGMKMSADDRREHLPYVQAGFVVASFDISGTTMAKATTSDFQAEQCERFKQRVGASRTRLKRSI